MTETPEIIYPPKPPEPDNDIDADYENWLASLGPDPEDETVGEVKFCGGDHKRCL